MVDEPDLLKTDLLSETTPAGDVEVAPTPEATPATPETVPKPEVAPETQAEIAPEPSEQASEAQPIAETELAEGPGAPLPPPAPKDPIVIEIEELLAEDLADIYLNLPDAKKAAFKQKGEEVALAIGKMIQSGKIKVKKILDLIRDWLKIIPGINKYFLEQESKIKTDNIMDYIKARQDNQNQK